MKVLKSNLPIFLILLFSFISITSLFSQSSLFSYEKYISVSGDTLNYRQLVSDYDSKNKYPLVIFLHGSGERGNDNESQLKWGVGNFALPKNMKMYPSIVIAPQCPKNMRWGNFSKKDMSLKPSPTKPMKLLIELINEIILKPRKGRGSRGLKINPKSFDGCSDKEYMVQELHKGDEITTAFYVNKNNKLHSFITFDRILENGMTSHCKVISKYDKQLKEILEKLIEVSKIKGSANIQSIVNSKGEIHPFEINCRISGTNSIRSNFGFEDVKYTLEEWLYNLNPSESIIKNGIATRVFMDVIYEGATDFSEISDNSTNPYIF